MLGGGTFGPGAVFVVFAVVLLIIALNVLFLGEETMGRSLDDISPRKRAPKLKRRAVAPPTPKLKSQLWLRQPLPYALFVRAL